MSLIDREQFLGRFPGFPDRFRSRFGRGGFGNRLRNRDNLLEEDLAGVFSESGFGFQNNGRFRQVIIPYILQRMRQQNRRIDSLENQIDETMLFIDELGNVQNYQQSEIDELFFLQRRPFPIPVPVPRPRPCNPCRPRDRCGRPRDDVFIQENVFVEDPGIRRGVDRFPGGQFGGFPGGQGRRVIGDGVSAERLSLDDLRSGVDGGRRRFF